MTNAILRGKPYAGNPHVRFDEGEVASETPRRGSLLYKRLVMVAVAFVSGVALAAVGNYCEWTGAVGDGKWGTPGNWKTVPVSGQNDVLVFDSAEPLVTENDVDELSIGGIVARGEGAKTLNGKRLTFSGNCIAALNNGGSLARSYSISNACPMTINLAIHCAGDVAVFGDTMQSRTKYVLRIASAVTMASGKTFRIGDAFAYNRDRTGDCSYEIDGAVGDGVGTLELSGWNSSIKLNGQIGVLNFKTDYTGAYYLPTASHSVRVGSGSISIFYDKPHFRGMDTFADETMVLGWGSGYYEKTKSTWLLEGYSQSIDRLGVGLDKSDAEGDGIESSSPATLTMKATADCSTFGILKGKLSVVWDPQEPRTLEFKNRVSSTSGTLDIRRGTLKLSGGATMKNVPTLKLASGAALTIAEGTTAACFKDAVAFEIADTATLNLPEGFVQTVALLAVDGVPVLSGTYSETATDGVKALPQIKGAGRIVVADPYNYWTGSVDTDWNTAGNWLIGVPTEGRPSAIRTHEACTVKVDAAPAAAAGDFLMKGWNGLVSLAVSAPMSFTNATVEIGEKARMTLTADSRLDFAARSTATSDTDVLWIHDGGELASSGAFEATNFYGRIAVTDGGKLTVTGGTFTVTTPVGTTKSSCLYAMGATVSIDNATVVFGNGNENNGAAQSVMKLWGGTTSSFSGSAYVGLDQWFWGPILGTGTHTFSDTAHMNAHKYVRGHFTAENPGETCTVVVKDNAIIDGFQEMAVGHGVAYSRTYLKICDNARVTPGSGFQVGCENGYGEVEVSGGTFSGGIAYGIHVGYRSPEDSRGSATTGHCPTGMLRVCGGTVNVRGSRKGSHPLGLVVGDGSNISATSGVTSRYTGFVELTSGTITHADGNGVIGCSYGFGRVTQRGGVFSGTVSTPMVVGFAGGEGEWLQTGGTASHNGDFFVGGIATNFNAVVAEQMVGWKTCQCLRRDAKGLLSVTGGTFGLTAGKTLYVSAFGAGTLALGGTGAVNVDNLVLTNTVDEANGKTYPATVKVTLSEAGAGLLTANKVTIAKGTKLIVDVGAYAGRNRKFLTATQEIQGAFAPSDISFVGENAACGKIQIVGNSIYAGVTHGMMIIVR